MNSLSILSTQVNKVIGNTPPPTPSGEPRTSSGSSPLRRGGGGGSDGGAAPAANPYFEGSAAVADEDEEQEDGIDGAEGDDVDEANKPASRRRSGGSRQVSMGERIYMSFLSPWLGAIKWIISTIATSTDWLASCFYSDEGALSPLMPLRRTARWVVRPWSKRQALQEKGSIPRTALQQHRDETDVGSVSGAVPVNSQGGHHRARSFNAGRRPSTVESITPRRSIRIQLYNDEKQQKNKSSSLKSPTSPSPSLRLTKYPRTAGPPVPLLSRKPPLKTLILDLDETLIHSLAKGGRMSSGHMVEVKLDRQHAILYYVHKRPYCDEFLRKVHRFSAPIFTLSPATGREMVQPRRLHRLGPGVRGSRDRLARAGP
jgi:CTD nuclear envelope phosphatase 1